MKTRIALISAFIGCFGMGSAIANAQGYVYERESGREREPFEYTLVDADAPTKVEDPVGDLVVFDRKSRNTVPPHLADLTSVTYIPGPDGWEVRFEIDEELPEDPGLAVNFFVYIDKDGEENTNAKNGVFRKGTDVTYMILHGTRTKWHTKHWVYHRDIDRWIEQSRKPEFDVEGTNFTLHIPYAELPRGDVKMRAFSLTSHDAITVVDVAPGSGIPPVDSNPNDEPSTPPEPPANSVESETDSGKHHGFILIALALLAFTTLMWRRNS